MVVLVQIQNISCLGPAHIRIEPPWVYRRVVEFPIVLWEQHRLGRFRRGLAATVYRGWKPPLPQKGNEIEHQSVTVVLVRGRFIDLILF